MAQEFMHKRYFQLFSEWDEADGDDKTWSSLPDKTAMTFTSTPQQVHDNLFQFPSVWNTNSPTKSYALEDSNQTLVVTYEFDTADDEAGFKTAVETAYTDKNAFASQDIKHIRTEWYNASGVEVTDDGAHS